jgi:streptogramin lyase
MAAISGPSFVAMPGPDRFGSECADSELDPILKFDPEGNVVESFGSGMFIWPHGIDVDADGNVWVTDAVSDNNIPHGRRPGSPRHQV